MRPSGLVKVLVVAALAATGCDTSTNPGADAGVDAGGGTAGAGGTGTTSSTSTTSCGQCVAGPPLLWGQPALVWIGEEKNAPDCPDGAPDVTYEGHTDLEAQHDCGTCTCSPSSGTCTLPATIVANAATCAAINSSTPHTPFNPPSGWDGSCDDGVSIASGKLCSGVHCVKSLTIGPLGVTEGACSPSLPTKPQGQPAWKTFARACRGPAPSCGNKDFSTCLPKPDPSAGFRVCIFRKGVHGCDSAAFPPYVENRVFYQSYEDTRGCAACTCGPSSGGSCSSQVTIFNDGACAVPAYDITATSAGIDCHDLPSGTPLGSKSATPPAYAPGTCTPGGGEPTGGVEPLEATTACCIPLP